MFLVSVVAEAAAAPIIGWRGFFCQMWNKLETMTLLRLVKRPFIR